MYLYWMKKQALFHPDIGHYNSYGIGAWTLPPHIKEAAFIPDVSTQMSAVLHLAVKCTLAQLDPEQLLDVVEDFLLEA